MVMSDHDSWPSRVRGEEPVAASFIERKCAEKKLHDLNDIIRDKW